MYFFLFSCDDQSNEILDSIPKSKDELNKSKAESYQSKIMAHRGFSGSAPENTMSAFQKALDIKVEFIELDVRKTKDDSLVVIHDDTIDRTCSNGKKGLISSLYYEDLSSINVGYSELFGGTYYSEKIPTLYEALKLCKGKAQVCIDLKSSNIEESTLRIVSSINSENEVIISSFSSVTISKIKKINNNIKTLFLVDSGSMEHIQTAKNLECFSIGVVNNQLLDEHYMTTANQNNISVSVYTVNSQSEMLRLMKLGVYAIMTDLPDQALKIKN
jgi:glycerophosphoryl diester phosphodiesterase